ncbi:penicillin-binding protein [Gracilibacillus orientalis]|uniref:Penicillin-binding protein n=1 Tax=Gracilibacillus orientalis TaxID=334253 RepID=A0A1I4N090_9BACI|nr:transglycosylase domain-containing protein [Gracilibacillus orientalis]SFM08972.1 penicillin-binding protein [Gracilibacillus orientalis]
MDTKDFFHNLWQSMKEIWNKKIIQRSTRISYHIIWNIVLFFITIGIIGGFFVAGLGAGYFASLVDDEEIQTEEQMASAVYDYEETSELYFADNNFLSDVSSDLLRDETSLDNVSEHVQNAVIATEDEYFETHNGIVPKAILRAVFQEVTNSTTKSGGSTLTQQVIKNQILTNEVSFERKAKEMLFAMRLERFFDKDEILEAYLNIVPFGRNSSGQNIAGIQTAANGIFDVDAKDLNLAQAAFIAGLPQSPSYYTPFLNGSGLKDDKGLEPGLNRMKSVLSRMLEAGYINEDEYQEALDYDIVADFKKPEESVLENYPYLMRELQDKAVAILVEVLAEQDGYSKEDLESSDILQEEYEIRANREIGRNGYKIHSTIDKEIYDVFQKTAREYNNYGRDKLARDKETNQPIMIEDPDTGEMKQLGEQPVQVGSVLIENSTGKILSFVGGRDFEKSEYNHATNVPRQFGSTMKPIAGYGPAMELGVVQPGSVIADVEKTYGDDYTPGNYSQRYYGLTTVREALYRSHNATAVSVFNEIRGPELAKNFLWKMGLEDITETQTSLAATVLGTIELTVEDNTNAYATFGNLGEFVEGYMIEKIETKDGEVVYQHESESEKVFSPQTSYLMIDMMRDVLTRSAGTGTAARANLANKSVDWAGKTGTTNDYRDTWFIATNPNVTLSSWMGYDNNQQLDQDGYSTRNNTFWAKLVNAATEVRPELMAPSQKFERPGGIVSRSYCAVSGLLPSDECSELGLVKTDIYNANYVPSKRDYSLIKENYATIDGNVVLSGEKTPDEFSDGDGVSFNPEWLKDMGYNKLANIKQLTAGKSGAWEKIKYPSDDNEVNNDGKAPNAPTSLKLNDQKLNWNNSKNSDVVGYRIYRASDPDSDDFQRIGSTAETSFSIPGSDAVYHVRAVDYFGQESKPSNVVEKGDFSEPEEEEEEEEEDKKADKDKDEEEDKDNAEEDEKKKQNNNNSDNNDSNNDDNSDNENSNNNSDSDSEPEPEEGNTD